MSQEPKYLKVTLEGPHSGDSWTLYDVLDANYEYTEKELDEMALDLVSGYYNWGRSIVGEAEVPEDERP